MTADSHAGLPTRERIARPQTVSGFGFSRFCYPRMSRGVYKVVRRLLILSVLALFALVVIAIAVLSSAVDRFRPQIQAEIQRKLNREVTLGHLGLRLFPFSVK